MKKSINAWVATFVACGTFVMGLILGNWFYKDQIQKINAYRRYCVATENLLDLIENKYHWVDAFDHLEYYESKDEVIFADWQGLDIAQKQFDKKNK